MIHFPAGYKLELTERNVTWWGWAAEMPSYIHRYTWTGLTADTDYTMTIWPFTRAGIGPAKRVYVTTAETPGKVYN